MTHRKLPGSMDWAYLVDDRDFCYAVATACTEAIKQFGFYGYRYSTESQSIKIYQLLFLKAYALGNMDARELAAVDQGGVLQIEF